jgi:oxygen-dependent protoporphyrinogen oxidase
MTIRRLGKSFLNYAVDPFLSGIYAGDPHTLITRHALPKLYNLEQQYGSFIGGSIKKAREVKKEAAGKARKGIFSTRGGMEQLPLAMTEAIGKEDISLSLNDMKVTPDRETGHWNTTARLQGEELTFRSRHLVTTPGAHQLPELLPFVDAATMEQLTRLRYAPVIQVAVGVKEVGKLRFNAFGGLIPSGEKEDFLGVLFPSSCFTGRSPEGGMLFSFFMGGIRNISYIDLPDCEIEEKVIRSFHRLLRFPVGKEPDLLRIFRHRHAIPQYERSSEERFQTISAIEKGYPGLHIAGNLRDGIGMSHRIIQGFRLAEEIR